MDLVSLAQNQTFVGIVASVSVLFVGFVFSEHLKIYKERRRGIAYLERLVRNNHSRLTKNTSLLNKWVECMRIKRPYKCELSKLATLSIEDTLLTNNLQLVNELIRQNDFFMDYNEDVIGNLHATYEDTKQMVVDGKLDAGDWNRFQDNLVSQVELFPVNSEKQLEELENLLAMIRVEWNIQRFSLIGFLHTTMFTNLYPRMTKEKIGCELDKVKINKEVARNASSE